VLVLSVVYCQHLRKELGLKRYLTRDRKTPAPSPDDLAEKECIDAAVQAAIQNIKPLVAGPGKTRTIHSLKESELRGILWGAISAWIAKRSELEAKLGDTLDQALNDPIDDLFR